MAGQRGAALPALRLPPPPVSRVESYIMAPEAAPFPAGFVLDVLVAVSIGGDGVAVADEPGAHILAATGYAAQHAAMPVGPFHGYLDLPAADRADERTLDPFAVFEPGAVAVFGPLVQLRGVETGEADPVAGDPEAVAIRHPCLAGDDAAGFRCWRAPPAAGRAPAPLPEEPEGGADKDGKKFHDPARLACFPPADTCPSACTARRRGYTSRRTEIVPKADLEAMTEVGGAALEAAAAERILVLDGAMGTMIQQLGLEEADFRGARFADWPQDVKGNNDLLSLTLPDAIADIHNVFLDAGADIVETNSFNANRISLADYGMEDLAREVAEASARIARTVVDGRRDGRPRWVAGAIGPTNRTASISPDVEDPAARNADFDMLRIAYRENAEGLIDGGADLIVIETVFDTLNAKAALYAVEEVFEARGRRLPVIVSGTVVDLSGRTLSGQTPEAFWYSVRHARPFAAGLNCALGAEQMRGFLADMARVADTLISAYPNAGLPNAFGGYDETPETTAAHLGAWARDGLVNLVGGCCGTTPAHIEAVAEAVAGVTPRKPPRMERRMRLAGLEPFVLAA